MAPVTMLAGLGVFVAALMARPSAFVDEAHDFAFDGSGTLTAQATGDELVLSAGGDDLGPDLLVYAVFGKPVVPADRATLPGGAVLLGPKVIGGPSRFPMSGDFRLLAIYSLGHAEVKEWVEFRRVDAEGGAR